MAIKRTCAFCGGGIEPGTGKMLVDMAGSVAFYCSSKCEKNVGLKRAPRKIRWTSAYQKEKAIRVQHLKGLKEKASQASKKEEKPKAAEAHKAQEKKPVTKK